MPHEKRPGARGQRDEILYRLGSPDDHLVSDQDRWSTDGGAASRQAVTGGANRSYSERTGSWVSFARIAKASCDDA